MIVNGKSARDLFYLDPDITPFNHGGFGGCPRPVLTKKKELEERMESSTDRWYRLEMWDILRKNVELLASHFHCDSEGIAFVDNVTFGVATILSNLSTSLNQGDAVLVTNLTYGTVKEAAKTCIESKGGNLVVLEFTFPIASNDDIVELFRQELDRHPNIRLAIIDHIPSVASMVMPVDNIIRLLQSRGVLVIVDGAHSTGQIIDLNIGSLGMEFYVGGLHKWFYAPRSLAFIWASAKYRNNLKPLIFSWRDNDPTLVNRFAFLGTRDITHMLIIEEILKFHETLGGRQAIDDYIKQLMTEGVSYLKETLHIETLAVSTPAPYMRMISLPEGFHRHYDVIDQLTNVTFESRWYDFLLQNYQLILPPIKHGGKIYIRLSVQVYNSMADFKRLAEVLTHWLHELDSRG